ncbi:hypothetical protein AB0G32_12095 [Streptomyces sp. NPDC023723]|uniref:hypothetical protein n=1 Tax=Streptomyces sp. NPDC023723 TaxID=3154323 RepID=UPI0033EA1C33
MSSRATPAPCRPGTGLLAAHGGPVQGLPAGAVTTALGQRDHWPTRRRDRLRAHRMADAAGVRDAALDRTTAGE